MLKKIKKAYSVSSFRKSIMAIRNRPLLLLYILVLDVAFFGVFYLLNLVVNQFLPDNPEIAVAMNSEMMFFGVMLLLSVLYFVAIILAYSFFSLIVLGNIRKMAHDYSHDLSLFKNMFLLNLLLFIVFFILLSALNFITALITNKPVWIAALVLLLLAVILIFAYAFQNFSHSTYILGHKLKDALRHSLKNTFSSAYLGILVFSLIFIIIYFGVYMLLGLILEGFIKSNYDAFVNTSSILTLIVVYVIFTFNRIYFFFVALRKSPKGIR